jgi:transmembrane sensor
MESKHREAAEWVARLHADDREADDDRAFRAWLESDADNAARFEHASGVWEDVGGLRGAIDREPLRQPLLSRRAVMTGAAAVTLSGTGLFAWSDARAGVYETAVGEQKRVTLADGSRLFLDTGTRLKARLGGSVRRLLLHRGRIHADIARNDRPFAIEAGSRKLVAAAGRFNAQLDEKLLSFVSLEGTAVVSDAEGGDAAAVDLRPGDRFLLRSEGTGVDRPDLRDMTVWQAGRAAFRNQTLAGAVAEMNRYSTQQLVIADPRSASLRISGVYSVGDNVRFARTITQLLPVRAEVSPSQIVLSAS